MLLATYDLWAFVSENWRELWHGLVNTIKVSLIAIVGSFAIGLMLGAARAHRIPVVSQFTAVYVEMIRNTPILVQIFMIFFALPQVGILLEPFTDAWVAVTIWGGAFNSENFRAGFEAVPHRYREAALALGFRPLATFLNVTLPIGGRIALPSSINTYISVVKNTSLMYVIGYTELTTTAINISNLTLETIEAITVLGIVYLIARLGAVGRDPPARVPAGASGGALDARLGGAGRPLHPRGRAPGDAPRGGGLADRQHGHRDRARDAADDPLPAEPLADPALHRGLPRPADPRHGLPRLLRPAADLTGARVRPLTATAIALILWGSAQVAEASRGAVGSIPASSTRRPPRSASAGSAGTAT